MLGSSTITPQITNIIYNGHKSSGCPRCGRDELMSSTQYRGNKGVRKFCCIKCEPIILDARKRAVERVSNWRKQQPDIKQYRNEEAKKYNSKECVREMTRVRRRKHYAENKEYLSGYRKKYIKEKPGFNRAASARHRALILQRTVKWANIDEIREFYKNCPPGMVVDHIIPLRGKTISGLHVRSNLQYLTAAENRKKSNKFEVDMRFN